MKNKKYSLLSINLLMLLFLSPAISVSLEFNAIEANSFFFSGYNEKYWNPETELLFTSSYAQKGAPARKKWCDTSVSAQYRRMRNNWQKVSNISAPMWRYGYRDLTFYAVNTGERIRVFPFLEDGSLDPEVFHEIEKIMADKNTSACHPIEPRLIKLLYKLCDNFEARQITIISGYRDPSYSNSSNSLHSKGFAVDFLLPGVPLPALAKAARRLGHVGVGFYPNAGYIHLDVRSGSSYFWADPSGPGKRRCTRQIMSDFVPRFDRAWKPEQDEPVLHKDKQGNPRQNKTIL